MASRETNERVVHTMVDDWLRGDMDAVAKAYSPEAVWHLPGNSRLSGDHAGWDAILAFFGQTYELTGGTIDIDVVDICVGDAHAVQWQRTTARHDGKTLDLLEAIVHRMDGGRIVETFHRTETDKLEAFFGTASGTGG